MNKRPEPQSGYALRDAIVETTRTLERRAWLFRNTVVGVILISLIAVSLSVLLRRLVPLLGLLAIVPAVGLFLLIDQRRVALWRQSILRLCPEGEMSRDLFERTIRGMRHLPGATIDSMLAALQATDPPGYHLLLWKMIAAILLLTAAPACIAIGVGHRSWQLIAAGSVMAVILVVLRRAG